MQQVGYWRRYSLTSEGFQSSPGQKAGCNLHGGSAEADLYWFQSSPGQKAGCNGTLTIGGTTISDMFQSSPGQKAGCNPQASASSTTEACFNPHPARRPGATLHSCQSGHCLFVSILTRPEGRVQLPEILSYRGTLKFQSSPGQKAGCNNGAAEAVVELSDVSILTRPEGRVQQWGG